MADTSTHASTERTAGEVWVPPRPSTLELAAGAWSGGLAAAGAPVLTPAIVRLLAPLNRGGEEHLVAGTGDEGWFGPHSVAWKVHSDIAMLVAGIGAFMLQTLHPRAMAGVFDHSSFGGDFFGRTRRTGEFVQGVVYGTSEEAQAWCDTVLAVHERVVGSTPDGRAYAANEPELLHWVHCTEYLAIAAATAASPPTR